MQDENLRKQEESVQKQEAMRRSKKSTSVDMTVTGLSNALQTRQGLSGLCEVTIKVVPIICQNNLLICQSDAAILICLVCKPTTVLFAFSTALYPDLFTPALYPGLLTLAFVAYTTDVGEGLVKLIIYRDIPGRWVNVWRSGAFIL